MQMQKLEVKLLWGWRIPSLFPVHCSHPDFWFHHQFWQNWRPIVLVWGTLHRHFINTIFVGICFTKCCVLFMSLWDSFLFHTRFLNKFFLPQNSCDWLLCNYTFSEVESSNLFQLTFQWLYSLANKPSMSSFSCRASNMTWQPNCISQTLRLLKELNCLLSLKETFFLLGKQHGMTTQLHFPNLKVLLKEMLC